jgi:hypothetical protein
MTHSEISRKGGKRRWRGKSKKQIALAMSILSKNGWKIRKLRALMKREMKKFPMSTISKSPVSWKIRKLRALKGKLK